jgi:hypothetical protein
MLCEQMNSSLPPLFSFLVIQYLKHIATSVLDMGKLTLENQVLLYEFYVLHKSTMKCQRKFMFPMVQVSNINTIQNIVTEERTDLLINRKSNRRHKVFFEAWTDLLDIYMKSF